MTEAAAKILVTGGAGFIGSHTVVALAEAGFEPVIIDSFVNSSEKVLTGLREILGRDVSCHQVDCVDEAALNRVVEQEGKVAGAIHFAAFKAVGESVKEPLKYYHNNVGSLLSLLRVMQRHQINAHVFSSSCTVYGVPDELPVTEETPRKPAFSPYGKTKQICEDIIADVARMPQGPRSIALRYFNPIGAHPSAKIGELPLGVPDNLVPYITQTAAGLRQELTVFGTDYPTPDGTCVRDYIEIMDLALAHVAALRRLLSGQGEAYEIFNIGTGHGNSVLELIRTFEQTTGQKLSYRLGARRDGDVPAVYADATLAEKVLGWKAEHSLAEALQNAWRWQQRQQ